MSAQWYVGRHPDCGCWVAATAPDRDKETARFVAQLIRDGLEVERADVEEVRRRLRSCPHRPQRKERQAHQGSLPL